MDQFAFDAEALQVLHEYQSEDVCMRELAQRHRVSLSTINRRLERGRKVAARILEDQGTSVLLERIEALEDASGRVESLEERVRELEMAKMVGQVVFK